MVSFSKKDVVKYKICKNRKGLVIQKIKDPLIFLFFVFYTREAFPGVIIELLMFFTSYFLCISRIPKFEEKKCEKQLKTECCLYWFHLYEAVVMYNCVSQLIS